MIFPELNGFLGSSLKYGPKLPVESRALELFVLFRSCDAVAGYVGVDVVSPFKYPGGMSLCWAAYRFIAFLRILRLSFAAVSFALCTGF